MEPIRNMTVKEAYITPNIFCYQENLSNFNKDILPCYLEIYFLHAQQVLKINEIQFIWPTIKLRDAWVYSQNSFQNLNARQFGTSNKE